MKQKPFKPLVFIALAFFFLSECGIVAPANKKVDNTADSVVKKEVYDGNLIQETTYRNGKKNGIDKLCCKDGKVISIKRYKNGVEDSVWVLYFDNENIERTFRFYDGKIFGGDFLYFRNGQLNKYRFKTYDEHVIYLRDYDSLGNITREDGFPYSISTVTDTLHINDTIEPWIFVGALSYWEAKIIVKDISNGKNEVIKDTTFNLPPDKDKFWNILRVPYQCREKGNFHWTIEMDINDKKYGRKLSKVIPLNFVVN